MDQLGDALFTPFARPEGGFLGKTEQFQFLTHATAFAQKMVRIASGERQALTIFQPFS
jgi:hypothetical protein